MDLIKSMVCLFLASDSLVLAGASYAGTPSGTLHVVAPEEPLPGVTTEIPVRIHPLAFGPEVYGPSAPAGQGANRRATPANLEGAFVAPDLIRAVLSADLSLRLPKDLVAKPDESTDEPRRQLTIFISEFYGDQGCRVTLRATWSLSGPAPNILHGNEEVIETPSGGCVGTMADAMSRALAQLTTYLALAISTQ